MVLLFHLRRAISGARTRLREPHVCRLVVETREIWFTIYASYTCRHIHSDMMLSFC